MDLNIGFRSEQDRDGDSLHVEGQMSSAAYDSVGVKGLGEFTSKLPPREQNEPRMARWMA